jgi:hypothetical protein
MHVIRYCLASFPSAGTLLANEQPLLSHLHTYPDKLKHLRLNRYRKTNITVSNISICLARVALYAVMQCCEPLAV